MIGPKLDTTPRHKDAPMHTLIIRHTAGDRFRVERLADGKLGPEVALEAPDQVRVEGRGRSHLLRDLTWYLEQFLDYPFRRIPSWPSASRPPSTAGAGAASSGSSPASRCSGTTRPARAASPI